MLILWWWFFLLIVVQPMPWPFPLSVDNIYSEVSKYILVSIVYISAFIGKKIFVMTCQGCPVPPTVVECWVFPSGLFWCFITLKGAKGVLHKTHVFLLTYLLKFVMHEIFMKPKHISKVTTSLHYFHNLLQPKLSLKKYSTVQIFTPFYLFFTVEMNWYI